MKVMVPHEGSRLVGHCWWHIKNSAIARVRSELTRGSAFIASIPAMSLALNRHFNMTTEVIVLFYYNMPYVLKRSIGNYNRILTDISVSNKTQSHKCLWRKTSGSLSEDWALSKYLKAEAVLEME